MWLRDFPSPQDGPELAVSAGLFPPHDFKLGYEIFADRKPAFYDLAGGAARRSSIAVALEWAPRLLWRRLRRLWLS